MTDLVAFDLDGTLIDTPTAIVETFTMALAALGAQPRDASAIRVTIGLPLEQAFGDLMGVLTDDPLVTRGVRQYQTLFREHVLPDARRLVFPGVTEGLEALHSQGFGLAVATSKFQTSANTLLAAAGLADQFAMVVGADQVSRPKPSPDTLHTILRHFGIPAERSVMVGDTTYDLLMAKAAGMRSIAVTYGVHSLAELQSVEPTWIVHAFQDVARLLQDDAAESAGAGDRHRASDSMSTHQQPTSVTRAARASKS